MNRVFASAVALLIGINSFAHDEGHGPKVTDQPKQGGMVGAIVELKNADQGNKAALVYKSELVRSEDGTITLYVYDKNMQPLDLNQFGKSAQAKIGPMKKNPKWKTEPFAMELKNGAFTGKAPKTKVKPFYIDITMTEGGKKLLTAYDNLD